ncbi:hypothetical protein M9458_056721, partial [Cirrhinus mrigala]
RCQLECTVVPRFFPGKPAKRANFSAYTVAISLIVRYVFPTVYFWMRYFPDSLRRTRSLGREHAEMAFVDGSCPHCERMSMAALRLRLSCSKRLPSAPSRPGTSGSMSLAATLVRKKGNLTVIVRNAPTGQPPRRSDSSRRSVEMPRESAGSSRGKPSVSLGAPEEDRMSIAASEGGLTPDKAEESAKQLPPVAAAQSEAHAELAAMLLRAAKSIGVDFPHSARTRPGSSLLTTLDDGATRGYADVPQVERAVAVHLCPQNAATWRNRPRLPSKACKLLSALAAKAYSAAGQAASALHAKANLQVHQAQTLKQLHESRPDKRVMQELCTVPWPASSATLSRTLPSSSRQFRSRPRRLSTSCPGVSPPSRRRPSLRLLVAEGASPRLLNLLHPRTHHLRSLRLLSGGVELAVGEEHSPLLRRPQQRERSASRRGNPEMGDLEMGEIALRGTSTSAPPPPGEGWGLTRTRVVHFKETPLGRSTQVGGVAIAISWLIQTVRLGYAIQFARPKFRGILFTSVHSDTDASVLRAEIAVLLAKDAIESVPPAEMKLGFYSPYFIVPKKNGGFESVSSKDADWFAAIDLKDAYFHVLILPRHRPFLRFAFEGRAYQYKVLPFGLALSVARFVVRAQAPGASASQSFGASGQLGKEQALPCAELDPVNMMARFTEKRVQSVLSCLSLIRHSTVVPLKIFQRLLGHMAAAAAVTPLGLLHMRPLQHWLHGWIPRWAWHRGTFRVGVTPECRLLFSPWSDLAFLQAGVPLGQVLRHVIVNTDASSMGWGAVCHGQAASGSWTGLRLQWHINYLELLAVFLPPDVARGTCAGPHGQHGDGRLYQSPRGFAFRSHVATRPPSPPLESKVAQIATCHSHSGGAEPCSRCALTPAYSPWRMETPSPGGPADLEPIRGSSDRSVCFPGIRPLFYSLTEAPLGTDALAHSWPRGLIKYAFPPVSLLAQTLCKIWEDEEQVLLVAPYWPTRTWFAELMLLATAPPWKIPLRKDLLSQGMGTIWHPHPDLWNLHDPQRCSIGVVLSFLQEKLERRLSPSTLKIYVAAIAAYHDAVDGLSLGRHHLIVRFLRGARRLNPHRLHLIPSWDLSVVLMGLRRDPFEPLESVELKFLSLKTSLLITLTSIKRVGDLHAFSVSESCLEFGPADSHVRLRSQPGYVPKVPTTPFRDQVVNLQALPPEEADLALGLLCPVRALRIYVDRTRSFRCSEQLFVCFGGQQKGNAVSKQRLTHWVVDAITLAYQLQGEPCPLGVRAHSTRSVASSWALAHGASLVDICRAAGWATPNTFTKFYNFRVEPVSSQVLRFIQTVNLCGTKCTESHRSDGILERGCNEKASA